MATCSTPISCSTGQSRRKARKLLDQDYDSLIETSKLHMQTNRIHSPLFVGRQMFSCFLERRASSCITVIWEDKHHQTSPFSSSPFFQLLLLSQFGLAVPAVTPLSFWPTPALLLAAWKNMKEKQHCPAIPRTQMCCRHCSVHKCKAWHRGCCGESQPPPNQTQYITYRVCFLNCLILKQSQVWVPKIEIIVKFSMQTFLGTGWTNLRKLRSILMGIHTHQSVEMFASH